MSEDEELSHLVGTILDATLDPALPWTEQRARMDRVGARVTAAVVVSLIVLIAISNGLIWILRIA